MEIKVNYKKSFVARLILSSSDSKSYYQTIKDSLLAYSKVHTRLSWTKETVTIGRKKVGIINVKGKTLVLYLGLNPEKFMDTKYRFVDVSEKKQYDEVPMMVKIKSQRGLKYALELIEIMMLALEAPLSKKAIEFIDYVDLYHERSIEEMLEQGYVKKVDKAIKNDEDDDVEDTNETQLEDKVEVQLEDKSEIIKTFDITFVAKVVNENMTIKNLYVVGNIAELGEWNPKQGIAMIKNKDGLFKVTVKIPAMSHIEFKIVKENSWYGVEKGIFAEEINNHCYDVMNNKTIEDIIHNFRM